MAERLTQLCALLEAPQVPIGTVIQLSNLPTASRIEQAAQARAALPNEPASDEEDKSTDTLRNLLPIIEG